MQRRLITVNIHEDAISLFVYTDILPHFVKNVYLRQVFMLWVVHATDQWMRWFCIVQCSDKRFIFISERHINAVNKISR